ncbi:MAG: VWA domain-containing protein [Hyphomicrobiales bacterium]|nr:VWA domain-containing protein [Hyphomicrobiales bacterium]
MNEGSASPLPLAAQPFHAFATVLRDHGFTVVTDQIVTFMNAISVLGPRSIRDVYWAARATLAPPIERTAAFDALFDSFFRAESDLGVVAESMPEERAPARESGTTDLDPAAAEKANESGQASSEADAPSARSFAAMSRNDRLALMRRRLGDLAPRRRGYRRVPSRRGDRLDLRRSLSAMIQPGAHATRPAWTRRTKSLRRVLLLLDISGSMKRETDDYLHFAHALTQAMPAVETFSFGTRLTRLTRSLRHSDINRAIGEIAPAVADWQGGTRIGESLQTFLSVPRFARASRGALIVVLSDGLERGDPIEMARAVRRLAARSWRMAWLTPLAAHPDFRPETEALAAILPIVDCIGVGAGIAALCDFIEQSTRLGDHAPAPGRSGGKHGNPYHRRTSSHLASGGPPVAGGPHAAAHLRAI